MIIALATVVAVVIGMVAETSQYYDLGAAPRSPTAGAAAVAAVCRRQRSG